MKLVLFVSLLVLCFASGTETEQVESHFNDFPYDDLDFDIEGLSFDEVRMKWRLLQELYQVVEEMESGQDNYVRKRFIGGFLNKTKNAISRGAHKIQAYFTNQYYQAKASFYNFTTNLTFDKVVKKLTPYISSDYSLGACTAACVAASTPILGPAAPLSSLLCGPACKGALSKIQDAVGR